MDRGTRRQRTARVTAAQRRIRLRTTWDTCPAWILVPPLRAEAGRFATRKALSCGCRRHGRGCSPKLAASLCHRSAGGYHPAVRARIDAKRQLQRDIADAAW